MSSLAWGGPCGESGVTSWLRPALLVALGTAAMASLTLPACCILPIPHDESVLRGNRVTPAQLEAFVPGVTTRTEIETLLGPPEVFWVDKGVTYYRWEVSTWTIFVAVGGGYGGTGGAFDVAEIRLLLFAYDAAGVVLRFAIRECRDSTELAQILRQWAEEGAEP